MGWWSGLAARAPAASAAPARHLLLARLVVVAPCSRSTSSSPGLLWLRPAARAPPTPPKVWFGMGTVCCCTHVTARFALAKGEWEQQDAIAAVVAPDGWRAAMPLRSMLL